MKPFPVLPLYALIIIRIGADIIYRNPSVGRVDRTAKVTPASPSSGDADPLQLHPDRPWGPAHETLLKPLYSSMDSARVQCRIDPVHGGTGVLSRTFTGKGVLVGIVDTEFDIRHPAFLDSLGNTRFIALWDQTLTANKQNRFGYGVIKSNAELQVDSLFGLGEDTHGTFVASFAAGNDPGADFRGAAPKALLVGVKRTSSDTTIVDGIKWIFSLADSLRIPCVVNLSIGSQVGPHDGTSYLDRQIDSLSREGRIVVGAAGNDFPQKVHAAWTIVRGQERGSWAAAGGIAADDGSTKYYSRVDMWGEAGRPFTVTISVIDTVTRKRRTYRSLSLPLSLSYGYDSTTWTDSTTMKTEPIQFYFAAERSNAANRRPHAFVVLVSKNPVLALGTMASTTSTTPTTVHAWNASKLPLLSLGIVNYVQGDTVMTISEVGGTAKRIITVGGYISKTRLQRWDGSWVGSESAGHPMWDYSGSGPTLDGRTKPDICSPAALVVGALNRRMVSTLVTRWPDTTRLTSRYMYESGTSIASPIVAGIVALMLEADATLTPEEVRQNLQETAIRDADTGPITTPNNRWGAGKVDALAAVSRTMGVAQRRAIVAQSTYPSGFSVTPTRHGRLRVVLPTSIAPADVLVSVYTPSGRRVEQIALSKGVDVALTADRIAGFYVVALENLQGRRLWARSMALGTGQ